nr:hypothetical protein [Tanacetum cinerariifolium]
MRTFHPRVFESAQHSFDVALRFAIERIVTNSGPGFRDWQWRLATLPFAFGRLGVSPAGDVLNYAFLASQLQSASLQTKLLWHFGIMDLWKSQMEDHTSDWLREVSISGLRHTMNGKTYRCVICYRLGVPLFSFWKPCLACSQVFARDIYKYHVVSCVGIIGIKHRHNIVRDTLVDICYRSGILASKEIDIGLDGGHDKPLRLADMILYSWDGGLDVCVDLTGSSPQTEMADCASEHAVIDAPYNVHVSSIRLSVRLLDMSLSHFHSLP